MSNNHTSSKSKIPAASLAIATIGFIPPAFADTNGTVQDWTSTASQLVQNNMSYPHMAEYRGESGTSYVRVTIDSEGNIQDVFLAGTSGSKRLDKAALETIETIGQFPETEFTSDNDTTFTVGLNYVLDDGFGPAPAYNSGRRGHVSTRDVAQAGSEDFYATIEFNTSAEG